MKTIAYTALHYGADYLGYAIRSVIDHIDEYHVLYTPVGSHGARTDRPCPDSAETLYNIASTAAGAKLHWHAGMWDYEGQQRDAIHAIVPDADVVLVLDADEIWPYDLVMGCIANADLNVRTWRTPIIHFWRSFYRAVLHDPAWPVRAIYPKHTNGINGTYSSMHLHPICHMGYAQRSELVEYKQHTHGHKGEWRKDDWFNTVFMANAQTNCHPVGSEYWNPEPVNPLDYMPEFMKDHPYFNMEVIP